MLETLKTIIATRGVQLLARYVGMGTAILATKTGADIAPDDAAGFNKVVAGFVVAGLCILIDHFSHKKQAA